MQAEEDSAGLATFDQNSFRNLKNSIFEIIDLTQRARNELPQLD
jgi:hypothetical protein